MKITHALLAEHVVFHGLFDHIERVIPRLKSLGEVKAVAGLLETVLKHHGEVEDELLIEPMQPVFHQLGQEESYHEEHEEIDESLRLVQKARSTTQAKRLLLKAVIESRKHFDKEERIVFPLAEKHLSARSQELLGKKWERARRK